MDGNIRLEVRNEDLLSGLYSDVNLDEEIMVVAFVMGWWSLDDVWYYFYVEIA